MRKSFVGNTFPFLLALGLLLGFGCAGRMLAQTTSNQLNLSNNYILTGDYVVGGVGLRDMGTHGMATGTITIPDAASVPATGVPAGADIVGAFLYWETVEKPSTFAGKQGYFNGFAITGDVLGNSATPIYWGSDGCSGSSDGKTVLQAYRADVRPFLPLDANGKVQTPNLATPGQYQVSLADSGTDDSVAPHTFGASLVIIYRVLSPKTPLNAIIIYDGAAAPTNSGSAVSQQITGFYQAAASPNVKLTHIVGNGYPNKSGSVYVNNIKLPTLSTGVAPFPGKYHQNQYSEDGGGSWDNPTWNSSNSSINTAISAYDQSPVTVTVSPSGSDCGCVNWGIVIFSTTVQDSDGDGLLDVWEDNQGYTDVISGQFVALPGANKNVKDLFVEVDYLTNLDGSAGNYKHSHLPKQAALDAMGDAFAKNNVHVHFDLGPTGYANKCSTTNPATCPDPYIIPSGTGGNAISEGALVCTDTPTSLCQYPGSPAVAWKEGLLFVKNNATIPENTSIPLGNFQFGRKDSYHYLLFGHALGEPISFWTAFGSTVPDPSFAKLVSIVNSGTTATVTIQSPPPPGVIKPGDCPNPSIKACSSSNTDRITVAGALVQTALNGTYRFTNLTSSTDANNVTTTTFNITTAGVADGTYNFGNEARLQIMYLGPTSSSGHSDLGGGDSMVTFGLWGADDPVTIPACQGDPSVALQTGQAYCNNQVGTVLQQAGTMMHEIGHTLTLTHGGTYYLNPSTPSVATYDPNCKPNFLSVMSYMFQVRGFPDGGFDYSGQTLQTLDETALNEAIGLGVDLFTGKPATHSTRWYAPADALDIKLGRTASAHCDGTPIGANEPQTVRLAGSTPPVPIIDWNHNQVVPDASEPIGWQDVNFIGSTASAPAPPFQGYNDWANADLSQLAARENALGYSGGTGAGAHSQAIGGGVKLQSIGGGVLFQAIGGGAHAQAIGGGAHSQAIGGGARQQAVGGGTELDVDTANATADEADAPTGLTAVESGTSVLLNWVGPGFGQVRSYDIWRAVGSFPTAASVVANSALFTNIATVTGAPPVTTFTDSTVVGNTYTYFVTERNLQGTLSAPSLPAVVLVQGGTSTGVLASPSSPVFGAPVTLTATITPSAGAAAGTPTGTVTFNDGSTLLGTQPLTAGVASFTTTSPLTLGAHSITVSYSGDTNFFPSNSSLTVTVNQAATATVVTTTVGSPVYGQPLTLTATVGAVAPGAGTPTGTVTFLDGANSIGTAPLSGGTGSVTVSSLGAGSHSFAATYSGDTNFTGSTPATPLPVVINPAPATITLGSLSATYDGTPKAVTATTSPDGLTVSYTYNGSPTAPTGAGTYAVVATITSANYQGTAGSTLTIAPRAASVSPTAATKIYGTADPTFTGNLSGFLPGDNVSANYTRTAGESVVGSYSISATLSPTGILGNYAITYNTASFTITPAAASVTPAAATKVYGTADPTFNGTLAGFLPADNVKASYTRNTGETVAGSYTISATLNPSTVLSNYAVTYNTASFTITPAAASVTPAAATKIYGAAEPVLTGTLSGFIATDGVTAAYSRTAGTNVGTYTISATLSPSAVLSNYNITYNTAAFTITQAMASVTPNPASKQYGANDPVFTGTLSGFLASDSVTAVYSRTTGSNVGTYTISATLNPASALSNYSITYNTAPFTITQAVASVSPAAATKVYGTTDPPLTGTLSGFQAADGVTATYNRTPGNAAGSYTITATLTPAAALANYAITYNSATFTITRAPASVTPAPATKVYGTADPAFTGSLSGFLASDGVTATYSRTPGETVAGTYTISAALSPAAVLGNYTIAYNTAPFTITKAAAKVTLGNLSQAYTGNPLSPTVTTVPAGLAYTLTGAPDTNAGSYPVTATVTDPNYTGAANGTFVITRPGASVSPSTLAFGTVKVGTTNSKNVTLTNVGTATLTISSIKITSPGVDLDDVTITAKTCGSTLAAGASCTITVTFKPDAVDNGRSTTSTIATLTILDNAPITTQTVTITGN